jgi:dTDP-4-dehydrorhamnose reductase
LLNAEGWLITGSTGLVGTAVSSAARGRGVEVVGTSLSGGGGAIAFDLTNSRGIRPFLDRINPGKVIHLAACARPAEVESRPEQAARLNVVASQVIAEWCRERGRPFIFSSSDQVFGGGRGGPYSESDAPAPTTAYGRTKLAGEAAALAAGGLVVRLGWVINDTTREDRDFVQRAIARLGQGERVTAADDEFRTPVRSSVAAATIVDLARLGCHGTVNVAGDLHVTPYQLLMDSIPSGRSAHLVDRVSYRDLAPAGRPGDVRLAAFRMKGLLSRRPIPALAN